MEDLALLIGGAIIGSLPSLYLLTRKPAETLPENPIVELAGVEMSPRGGHKHDRSVLLPDGWHCGKEVEPGIICGWLMGPKNG